MPHRRAARRRTLLALPAGLAALALLAVGCSGADDDTPQEPGGPRVVSAAIERVDPAEGDPLWAGAGESRLEIDGVAGDGESIVAAGSRRAEGGDAVPELLRSADGREWASVELPSELAAGVEFVDVVDAGEQFLVVGNHTDGSGAVGVRTDGEAVEAVEVAFPVPDGGRPAQVRAVLTAGDRLYAAGVSAVGTVDEPTRALARLVVVTSDDAGATWSALDLPEEMSVLATGPIVLEASASGGGGVGEVSLAGHDDTPFVVTEVPGAEGTVTSIWRGDDAGAEWTGLGAADELFDGQVLDLLHGHGGDLLAFTRAGTDTALWRSDDDGGTFERVETDPAVFGGGGQQVVDTATTIDDGSLVVVGATRGDARAGRVQGELEVWVTADLETWNRSLTDPALGGYGGQRAAGVVPMGAELVVVGTHERPLTGDDDEAFEEAGQRAIAAPMQHGVAWIVALEDTAPADPGLDVRPLEVSGFDGETSINGLTAFEDGLVAVGSVEVSRPSDDESDEDEDDDVAAVWTSADGAAWTRVESPALAEPAGQVINDVVATDAGLVAVGYTTVGDETALAVWTSADGAAWTRVELGAPEFEGSVAYAVTAGPDGLVAVGTSSPEGRGYRDVGVWTSADAGQSWQALPTTDEPFQAHDIELLSGVAVTEDGTIVAAGHSGTAEQRPGSGYSYSPVPYVVESADGQEWSVVETPYGETDNGQADLVYIDSAAGEADAVTVAGSVNAPATYPVGSFALSQSGLSRRVDGEWQVPEQRFRHRTWLRDWDDGVIVGEWHRGPGGSDALIAVTDGGALVPVTDAAVIAEGDQTASVAARLGDNLVVLGSDTTDDDAVIGWRVTSR